MEESTTYQEIIEKGEAKGEARGLEKGRILQARAFVVQVGTSRFGPANPAVSRQLESVSDLRQLTAMVDAILDGSAKGWTEIPGLPR